VSKQKTIAGGEVSAGIAKIFLISIGPTYDYPHSRSSLWACHNDRSAFSAFKPLAVWQMAGALWLGPCTDSALKMDRKKQFVLKSWAW